MSGEKVQLSCAEDGRRKKPCADESECVYQPFCRLNERCMRLTAIGPMRTSRNLRPKKERANAR